MLCCHRFHAYMKIARRQCKKMSFLHYNFMLLLCIHRYVCCVSSASLCVRGGAFAGLVMVSMLS